MAIEGENLGVATIYLTVDKTSMDATIGKAKLQLAGMGAEASKQYDAMSASQRKIAQSLVKQTDLINKTTAERVAYNAQLKIGGALGNEIAAKALANAQATAGAQGEATAAIKAAADAQAEMAAAEDARFKQIASDAMAEVEARQAVVAATMEQARANAALIESRSARGGIGAAGIGAAGVGAAGAGALDSAVVQQQIADYAALDAVMMKGNVTRDQVAEAEAALDHLQAQGMISNEELAETFAALDKATLSNTAELEANTAANVENAGAKKINSRTSYTISAIISDAASGQFSRSKRSIAALANETGVMSKAFALLKSGPGAGIAAAIVAVTAFGVAAFKGEEQTAAFNAALLKTGDASGSSVSSLEQATQALGAVTGSYGKAREAVLAIAGSGKISDAAMQKSARSALDYAKVTGVSVADAVKAVVSLGDDPVKALEKLDSSYHFLTPSVLGEVEALQEEGKNAQAAAVAEKAFADANGERAKQIVENLGWLQKAAHAIGKAFSSMWDSIEGIGRQAIPAEQLASLFAKLKDLQSFSTDPHLRDLKTPFNEQAIAQVKKQIKAIQSKLVSAGFVRYNAEMKTAAEKEFRSAVDGLKSGVKKYEDAGKKAAGEIANINKQLAVAIAGDPAHAALYRQESETQIAGIQARLAKHKRKGRATKDYSDKLHQMALDDITKEIQAQGKLDDAQARGAAEVKAFSDNLDAQLQTRKQVLALQVQEVGMGTKEAQQQQGLLSLQQQYESKQAELDKEHANHSRGMTDEQYAEESAKLKEHYDADVALTKEHYAEMDQAESNWVNGAIAAMQNWADQGANVADQTKTLFTNAFDGLNNALSTFVTTGKLNFSSLVTSILTDLAKMELRIAESKILQSILGAFMPSGTGIASSYMSGGGASYAASGVNWGVSLGSANGNAFDRDGLVRYALGGIVDSPTLFKFANGTGLMGEAGPEAIMPLSRGSDGKLGVKAAGGGNVININTQVTVDSNGARSTTSSDSSDSAAKQLGAMMEAKAKEVVGRAIQPGGLLWRHGVGQAA